MKTAISVPNETFEQVSRRAAHLHLSRSEFFTRAAKLYLTQLDAEVVTGDIDRVLSLIGPDDSAQEAVRAGRRRLAADNDDW
jgi:hypothetical protein